MGDMQEETWTSTDGTQAIIVRDPSIDISDSELRAAMQQHPELKVMSDWVASISTASANTRRATRTGGLLERDRYVNPIGIFDQFRVARDAAENDDVVGNVLETTEALVFNKVRVECGDEDEENIWDQIIQEMGLEARLREMWRDLFIYSQYYVAAIYENKTLKVQGVGEKRARRKTFSVTVPSELTLLDPLKVLPVGDFLFGQDQLAYIASKTEAANIEDVIAGKNTSDQVVSQLLTGKYTPDKAEMSLLSEVTGQSGSRAFDNLFSLNPFLVWRHTATRPSYTRFAPVRLASIFELLDLKHQVRQMDRAHLLGATNFIVLIRKGDKDQPATSEELSNLNNNVRQVARTPLIIGDHRLSIEIITPKMDLTLDPKRYNTLDSRISARLYQILHIGGFSAGASGDDSLKLARVIARGLESRRQMIKENIERNLLIPTWKLNDNLKGKPRLAFTPRAVSLDFDPNFLRVMMELYLDGSISRETISGVVDVEQEEEAHRREVEKERYDDIMVPRNLTAGQAGNQFGGNRNGGGNNPDSMTTNPSPRRAANDVPG